MSKFRISQAHDGRMTRWYKAIARRMSTVLKSDKASPAYGKDAWKVEFRNKVYMIVQFDEGRGTYGAVTHFFDGNKEIVIADECSMRSLFSKCDFSVKSAVALQEELSFVTITTIATAIGFYKKFNDFGIIDTPVNRVNASVVLKRLAAQKLTDDKTYYEFLEKITELESSDLFKGKTVNQIREVLEKGAAPIAEFMTANKLW